MKRPDRCGLGLTGILSAAVIITAVIFFAGCDFNGDRKDISTRSETDSYSNPGTLNITDDTNEIYGDFLPMN